MRDAPTTVGVLTLVASLTIGVGACASSSGGGSTPPRQTSQVRIGSGQPIELTAEAGVGESTFAASPATVWGTMTSVFEQLEIPVTTMDPGRMEIGNPSFKPRRIEGKRMNTYIDCGTSLNGQLANLYEITMTVMVRVTPDGTGSKVTTITDAYGQSRTVSGNPIHCETRGTLEDRVPEIIDEHLGGAY